MDPEMDEINPQEQNFEEINPEEQKQATNKKVAKLGAKAAANYFAPGKGGQVVDALSKTKIGDKALNKGGEIVSKVTNKHPFGGLMQNALNKADESGALDAVDSAADAKPGASAGGILPGLGKTDDSNSGLGQNNSPLSGLMKNNKLSPLKYKKMIIFAGVGVLIFIILILLLSIPFAMLDLTDRSRENDDNSKTNNYIISDTQIEKLLIYVGDSRINNIKNTINKSEVTYVAQDGAGYVWFSDNTVLNELQSYIGADTNKYVVFASGINDLNNIDNYINIYNSIISNYKNINFYFMSVNPIDEELATSNGFNITNDEIMAFNTKLSSAFPDNYIDVYSQILDNFTTVDGVHFDNETNLKIHNIILNYIKSNSTFKFLESYPSIKDTTTLQGESLLSAIGQSGIDEVKAYIQEKIDFSGKCTPSAVAGAAVGLIHGLQLKSVSVPYYWGGRYYGSDLINKEWGAKTAASFSGKNLYYYNGLDCSGFVHWAINAASIRSNAGSASSYLSLGDKISYEEAYPGALLVNNNHISILLEINPNDVQTAESTTGGVQFVKYSKDAVMKKYSIIDMIPYYQENCQV